MSVTFKGWSREGNHFHHTIVTWVKVPPEVAFAYAADITRHSEWSFDEIKVAPLTPGPVRLGSKYTAVGHQRGKDWPSQLEVTAYEPSSRFEFTATGGPIDTPVGDPHRHEFLFVPQNGGTQIEVQRTDPAPPNMPSWLFIYILSPLVLTYARGHRIETVRRLKERLDQLADTKSS